MVKLSLMKTFLELKSAVSVPTFNKSYKEKYVHMDSVFINNLLIENIDIGIHSKLPTHKRIPGLGFMSLFDRVIIDNQNQQILFLKEE